MEGDGSSQEDLRVETSRGDESTPKTTPDGTGEVKFNVERDRGGGRNDSDKCGMRHKDKGRGIDKENNLTFKVLPSQN